MGSIAATMKPLPAREEDRWRVEPPPQPTGELRPDPVPPADTPAPQPLMRILMPIIMAAAMLGMVGLMLIGGTNPNPMMLMFPIFMVMSMLMMFAPTSSEDPDEVRRAYLRHLGILSEEARKAAVAHKAHEEFCHPAPHTLWAMTESPRLWERLRGDDDVLITRIGCGAVPLSTPIIIPDMGATEDLDPVCLVAFRHTVQSSRAVHGMPLTVDFTAFPFVGIAGPGARDLARAMVASIAFFHGPELVGIDVFGDSAGRWDAVKWLPHNRDPLDATWTIVVVDESEVGANGGSYAAGEVREVLDTAGDHSVCLVVGADESTPLGHACWEDGLILYSHAQPTNTAGLTRVDVLKDSLGTTGMTLGVATEEGEQHIGTADQLTAAEFDELARSIGAFDRPDSGYESAAGSGELLPLLGVSTPEKIPLATLWNRGKKDLLAVPIGTDEAGRPVIIDMKESALGGVGPHGLCIGATGSGKSELLKTLVVSLALTHSPEDLNLILVDFKGGATFLELGNLPHTSAVITNLAEEETLVGRMEEAINGEMNRRQEVLRAAGVPNIGAYADKRLHSSELAPLPHLVIILDEFSELLGQHPDFADLFVAVGRLGRSLGVHLLLASQRLEEGRLRGLDSHLSYRIGLRTFSAGESRQVIGTGDAYHLPAKPGVGFLKTDADELVQFTASYVSGPVRHAVARSDDEALIQLFTGWRDDTGRAGDPGDSSATGSSASAERETVAGSPTPSDAAGAEDAPAETLVERVVKVCGEEAAARAVKAHTVWLPPLPAEVTLGEIMSTHSATDVPPLTVPVGIIDRPYLQRQDPFLLTLSGATGHLAICGGPQSGKTTAVRTLVLSFVATHTTADVAFYILDLGGGDLAELAPLPHVAGVAGRANVEAVHRVFTEVLRIIEDATAAHSPATEATGQGDSGGEAPRPTRRETFLIIDGFHVIGSDFEEHLDSVARIAADGLSAGVHLVVTAQRWSVIRPAIRDLIGGRMELHLTDPLDSLIARKAQEQVPPLPGRGLTPQGEQMLVALSSGEDIGYLRHRTQAQPAVPRLRLLPTQIARGELPGPRDGAVPIGIGGARLLPVAWHPDASQHLLGVGARGCGKTSLLLLVAQALTQVGRDSARLLVLDPRRGLLGRIAEPMLAGYAATTDAMATLVGQLVVTLAARMPSADVTPQELRERSWWEGPELFLLIDDLHLLPDTLFGPLAPYLPHARDIGLHVVATRKSGAFGRALYSPLLAGVVDAQPDVLVFSADPADGPIAGVKTALAIAGRAQLVRESARFGAVHIAQPDPDDPRDPPPAGAAEADPTQHN